MDIGIEWETLKTVFLPYIKSIQEFHFYYDNPLFWVFFMVVFLILVMARSWGQGKAFFFCATIAAILLGTTWFEGYIARVFIKPGESLDPLIIRVLCFIMVSAATIYYVLIDNS